MKHFLWDGLAEIMKMMMHRVTSYPTLDRKKTMQFLSQGEFEANTGVEWNRCGFSITSISN